MDMRRSYYLAARRDDFAEPAADAGWLDTTGILPVTPANDKRQIIRPLRGVLRCLIALHRLSRPN
jgi:hypothetical protein